VSLIERALQAETVDVPALAVPDAMAAILVASVAVDGEMQVEEAVRMGGILSANRAIRHLGQGSIAELAERAVALLVAHGLPAVLTACAKAIPIDLRPTVFALATDLVLADGRIGDRERTFIDELQTVLLIDDATALKIVDVMLIKNHG